MRCKRVCLVIHPREGQNFVRLTDILAVFAAAGWQTDLAIKEYPGHSVELATAAARQGYDLIIAYGGDGTVSQVINGVMNASGKGHGRSQSAVGVIPGGTANLWATELGIPADPVKAALALVNSEVRRVDVGRVEVQGLHFPGTAQERRSNDRQSQEKKTGLSSQARYYFLLMAGLGIDAAVLSHVKPSLKHRLGVFAINLSAAQTLSEQHPFPLEIQAMSRKKCRKVLWRGDALQVVVGNTRRRANDVEMTPNAYIDDGILDVCVIPAGTPLTTLQQATSLLLQRRPDDLTTEFFYGPHFSLHVPAPVALQLDGSAMKLNRYLSKSERTLLQQAEDLEHVLVTYQFDVLPGALHVAVPCAYDGDLFGHSASTKRPLPSSEQEADEKQSQQPEKQEYIEMNPSTRPLDIQPEQSQWADIERLEMLQAYGRKVVVVGVAADPEKKQTSIVAGSTPKLRTGELQPVAVVVDEGTSILTQTTQDASPTSVRELQEGMEMIVEGKKSKRGVISATRVLF